MTTLGICLDKLWTMFTKMSSQFSAMENLLFVTELFHFLLYFIASFLVNHMLKNVPGFLLIRFIRFRQYCIGFSVYFNKQLSLCVYVYNDIR